MNKWITRSLLTGASLTLAAYAYTYAEGPPAFRTGAPNDDGTCNAGGCHSGNQLNAAGGSITVSGVPAQYVPGAKYPISVQVAKPGQSRWGFELTAQTASGERGGEITVTDEANTQFASDAGGGATDPQYIEHTSQGTARGQKDTGPVRSFDWTAPATGTGTVTFYAAGNAANGNATNTGDFIYTTSVKSDEGSDTPAAVSGDLNGDAKVNVQDATISLQIAVGIVQPTEAQTAAGDVAPVPGTGPREGQKFGDGKVNVSDSTRILQFAVGLITEF